MSARDDLVSALEDGGHLDGHASRLLDAHRGEVLREAADEFEARGNIHDRIAASELRRMAAEAGGPARTQETGCAGFEPGDLCVRCGDARRWHRAEAGGAA